MYDQALKLVARGDIDEAVETLQHLRERHPSYSGRALAAFELARLHTKTNVPLSDAGVALMWLDIFLAEAEEGHPLVREAMGRRVELLDRLGRAGSRDAAARVYLQKFPGGPHADFAKEVLSQDALP